jgi:hypothetical protein
MEFIMELYIERLQNYIPKKLQYNIDERGEFSLTSLIYLSGDVMGKNYGTAVRIATFILLSSEKQHSGN